MSCHSVRPGGLELRRAISASMVELYAARCHRRDTMSTIFLDGAALTRAVGSAE